MLDLFGSKRRAILNSEQFQNNLTQVRDLRNLVLQMSQSFTSPALLKRLVQFDDNEVKNIVSVLSFTITANIHNPDLRVLLNHYYEDFYVKIIYKFHFDPSRHRNMTQDEYLRCMNNADIKEDEIQRANLNAISHSLFRTDSAFSLFESYKKRYGTKTSDFIYDGFGVPKRYVPSEDDYEDIPFSYRLFLDTGLRNEYRSGEMKSSATIQDERNFYAKILLDELNKI